MIIKGMVAGGQVFGAGLGYRARFVDARLREAPLPSRIPAPRPAHGLPHRSTAE